MITSPTARSAGKASLGISAIASHEPDWILSNDWFEDMPRKFVQHTGIRQRAISTRDEVGLAVQAARKVLQQSGATVSGCAGLIFTSPSFVPISVARKYLDADDVGREQLNRAAHRISEQLGAQPRRIAATNTFCAGFARALAIAQQKMAPELQLQDHEYILILTASRISRITDYGCRDTAGLFGDMATATLVTRADSQTLPVRLELLDVEVERKSTNRPFFDFQQRQQVVAPQQGGGRTIEERRVVFKMDGMGIADTAPRAMADAASKMLARTGLAAEDIRLIIPHQAGSAIVRLAEMKLRDVGFESEVVNGMTSDIGNVSSGSIPYALSKKWDELDGHVLCPLASVGPPGRPLVAQGCIALRASAAAATTR